MTHLHLLLKSLLVHYIYIFKEISIYLCSYFEIYSELHKFFDSVFLWMSQKNFFAHKCSFITNQILPNIICISGLTNPIYFFTAIRSTCLHLKPKNVFLTKYFCISGNKNPIYFFCAIRSTCLGEWSRDRILWDRN
jgi:hypothetical protein